MNTDTLVNRPLESADRTAPRRLFLREPGWCVGLKLDHARAFCHSMAPGQNYYHRLHEGEVYVFHGDERICMACAERRGLVAHEPKLLGDAAARHDAEIEFDPSKISGEFEVGDPPFFGANG